ncbi:MAG: MBL fold metallo-hydrolase [Sphingomonadaceae bacterium]|nr:MBL fold metallo-hydrolase [Sphingomonadaceae bacterium]
MTIDPVRELVAQRPTMFDHRFAGAMPPLTVNDFIHGVEAVSNIYLINTDDGDIQINAGMGFEVETIREQLAPFRKGPLTHIILTQGHFDHVGGVAQLREPGTKLVAHRANAECQKDDERILGTRNRQSQIWFPQPSKNNELLQEKVDFQVQDRPTPDITFEDRMELDVGGLKLELLSMRGGETVDSIAIHLPQHGIVFNGNQLGPMFPHFPNIHTIRGDKYRFWEVYLASLRRLRDLEPEILVTGHFEPIVGKDLIRTCLDRLDDAVSYVHQTTLDGMNAGKDIFTLMREVTLPDELYVGHGYGKVSFCVRTVWEQYMGWFHGKRTSQLLSVQPDHVAGELAEMAGAEAVIARGQAAFDAGDTEKAITLLEAALAAEPGNEAALKLSIAAHEKLLDDPLNGDNFWFAGWLRYQIAKSKESLEKGSS